VAVDAHVAQSVEHFLGKEEVTGSNPVVGLVGVGSHRLTVRTPLFQGGDRGSIPRGSVGGRSFTPQIERRSRA